MGNYEKTSWGKNRDQDLEREQRESVREIGIGIMLVAVVVGGRYHEPDERFGSHRREVRVVVKGEGGQLMNGGGDCRTPNYSDRTVFFWFIVQCTYFLEICFYHFNIFTVITIILTPYLFQVQ